MLPLPNSSTPAPLHLSVPRSLRFSGAERDQALAMAQLTGAERQRTALGGAPLTGAAEQ